MKFKEIEFTDKNAQRVYENYLKRIKRVTKPISKEDAQEVLMEFNSHIYENLQNNAQGELDNLLNAIDRLGQPEEFLKPLIADKLLEKATKSFNPVHVFRALALNLTNGISYIIFFILYMCLGGFIFLIIAKLFISDEVGLYFKKGEFLVLGMSDGAVGAEEILGHWFIPAMLLCIVIFYLFITLLLKLKKAILKK